MVIVTYEDIHHLRRKLERIDKESKLMNGQPNAVQEKLKEIPEQVEAYDRLLIDLADVIAGLEGKLKPVLKESTAEKSEGEVPMSSSTELGCTLERHNNRLRCGIDDIRFLVGKIEL